MNNLVPTPANESERIAEIRQLCLINPEPDRAFDKIVALAAELFQVPIALISIIDTHRQWFSASVGLTISETPREHSFCSHAILSDELFMVSDATQDHRFKDNPLVTGEPHIRFYAGAPLLTQQGLGLGSLYIIDTKPRPALDKHQVKLLNQLAELVMARVETLRNLNFIGLPTGLFNRPRLERDVSSFFSDQDLPITLVAVDVIAPRILNDIVKALGYTFSERLMLLIRDRLQAVVPKDLALYRISPTRIAFMLADIETEAAETLYRHILESFEAPLVCDTIPIQTQIGLGILVLNKEKARSTDWIRSLVSAADDARENNAGWEMYSPRRDHAQQRAFRLLSALTIALQADDQLRLYFQPKIQLATSECTSVEALLRWRHPTLGDISPGEFIPLAEKTFLIRSVSLWVLKAAVKQAKAWQQQGLNLTVAINVSAADLDDEVFTDTLTALLREYDLPAQRLEVEFTEGALIRQTEVVQRQLERIHDLGIVIAIDDFGTGYSNWSYLRDIPASVVKLDQSFIRNTLRQEKDKRIVKAMIKLAKEMDYRVVAEGIETEEIYKLMRNWGCDEGQGYLMARPMPALALLEWLESKPLRY
ncbi:MULTISPECIES: sensor domain-containing phosphodiesterase [Pseudomonas]|uniref:EAL domain, c-di-GMP-specific phosphodiesterase class I (Or its enzymatically inactive variant) n=1 Tax=Pseudomonas lutea TaxID=243924 RepID=A0A9X8MAY7_9PSED|nr:MULTISPECIES: sensor domain-containing phosphodiesterase [Pseudomonas]SEQ13912.1 EAL domain, c-di-GMP-specific phosphodiesterase class I (or its enzymatically inactive variant) [Pseudomonas lutea]